MTGEIKKSDWKTFRRLHKVALERFCQQVIEEIRQVTSGVTENYHEHYLEVFRLIMGRNEEMARAFDDMRRSRAFILLANIKEKAAADRRRVFWSSVRTRAKPSN
jgi:hypothetical protein